MNNKNKSYRAWVQDGMKREALTDVTGAQEETVVDTI